MTEIKKILTPVPLGSDCRIAIKQAMIFHEVYGSEIILLHVETEFSFFHRLLKPSRLKKHIKRAKKKLKKYARNYFGGEIPDFISMQISTGELIQEILLAAKKTKCDLIIISKGKRIVSRLSFLKNENADKLISGAVCPVLTISGKHTEKGIKDILIPVDITKKITNKVAWVKYLAKKFNAKVHVISVLDLDITPLESLAHRKALEIENSIKEVGLDVNVELLKANNRSMHDVVLSYIGELKPDLVLMMTHQESILFDNYIGKFAGELIHRSESQVFNLVPRKETIIENLFDSFDTQRKAGRILI
ncbi:MAG: universal stress protein [Candidatus Aminicenantes bacterium]|nr:universal stress protein [Candidatus Aminicenantes bacterium]